jgi:hypothetical protein
MRRKEKRVIEGEGGEELIEGGNAEVGHYGEG